MTCGGHQGCLRVCYCHDIVYTCCMQNTTIQLRIDTKTKKQAQQKFRALGLDLSSGMKLLLTQAITDEHLSFVPTTTDGLKLRHWKLYKKEIAWGKKHGKRYTTAEEMHADILNGVK